MRQVAHILPHLIQIAFGMTRVGGKQQFGSQNVVAHAVMQFLGYTLALVFQSADVALTLLQHSLLGSQSPAVEQCTQQSQQRYREHHQAEHLIGQFRLLAFRLGQRLLCLQCLVFHRKLAHAPLYVALLHGVQQDVSFFHLIQSLSLLPQPLQALGFHAQQSVHRHHLVLGTAGYQAIYQSQLLGIPSLSSQHVGLYDQDAQCSVAAGCHASHCAVGILHVFAHGMIVAQQAVRLQDNGKKLQREHIIVHSLHLLPAWQHGIKGFLRFVLPQIHTADIGSGRQPLYGITGRLRCPLGLLGILDSLGKTVALGIQHRHTIVQINFILGIMFLQSQLYTFLILHEGRIHLSLTAISHPHRAAQIEHRLHILQLPGQLISLMRHTYSLCHPAHIHQRHRLLAHQPAPDAVGRMHLQSAVGQLQCSLLVASRTEFGHLLQHGISLLRRLLFALLAARDHQRQEHHQQNKSSHIIIMCRVHIYLSPSSTPGDDLHALLFRPQRSNFFSAYFPKDLPKATTTSQR